MSLQMELHEAHKARQRRLGITPPPRRRISVVVRYSAPPVVTEHIEPKPILEALEPKEVALPLPPEPPPSVYPTIHKIQNIVASHLSVSVVDMCSERRDAKVTRPRHIAMYLCKILTTNSYPKIGKYFGGKDHTTCLHAFRKIEAELITDCELRELVDGLKAKIAEAAA